MAKTLIILNGPMGIGKTTVCNCLKKRLQPCFFLDGDWCWDMSPFTVSQENKEMVLNNIVYLLNSFLKNDFSKTVLFCWVLPDEKIIDEITGRLKEKVRVIKISLICSAGVLENRLKTRQNVCRETFEKSLSYLPKYRHMDTFKIQTDDLTVEQTADEIQKILMNT